MNNKGMTLVELIIIIFIILILSLFIYTSIRYGNKPVSEMPVWLYILTR